MLSNNPEYLTNSFFCLLLLNDPDSIKKAKFNDENHYKVLYILELEKIYNLKRFQFELIDSEEPIITDSEFFRKMNVLFKTKLRLPRTYNELINYYYLRLNNLIGKLGFMNRTTILSKEMTDKATILGQALLRNVTYKNSK